MIRKVTELADITSILAANLAFEFLSRMAYILPYWAQAGGGKAVGERLNDSKMRSRLKKDWEKNSNDGKIAVACVTGPTF